MSAEIEAIIKISSYVHDIGVMMACQTICFIAITLCIIFLNVDKFFK